MPENGGRILVLTVGTGDIDSIEKTLLVPLRKSIATDAWNAVVLLPSTVTEEFALRLREGIAGARVEIHPLPAGAENDADRAYAHFDGVLQSVLQSARPERVEVDFTRGTKAMSAALVLAAARRGIPGLRYVVGRRDRRGMVEPGSEEVRRIHTTTVEGHRRLDLVRALMLRGDFSAVTDVLPDPHQPFAAVAYPADVRAAFGAIRSTARFYAAWDRLDYRSASKVNVAAPPSGDWNPLWPTDAMRAWVTALHGEPDRSDCSAMAAWLRRLVVDLLANGERRIRHGQHEDALVRGYRVLELVGQMRLFDHGLDSANLDTNHQAVEALQERLARKNDARLAVGPGGELRAAREQTARLLKRCGDALAGRLLAFESRLKPTLRNTSVLVHGFAARAPADPGVLHGLFSDLEALVREDGAPHVDERLRVARSPSLGRD